MTHGVGTRHTPRRFPLLAQTQVGVGDETWPVTDSGQQAESRVRARRAGALEVGAEASALSDATVDLGGVAHDRVEDVAVRRPGVQVKVPCTMPVATPSTPAPSHTGRPQQTPNTTAPPRAMLTTGLGHRKPPPKTDRRRAPRRQPRRAHADAGGSPQRRTRRRGSPVTALRPAGVPGVRHLGRRSAHSPE